MRHVSSYLPSRDSLSRVRNLKDAATGCGYRMRAQDAATGWPERGRNVAACFSLRGREMRLRRLPDYELMTADERRRLAEHIRQTEDRPVSRCWRVSWKWGAKWKFTDDDAAGG